MLVSLKWLRDYVPTQRPAAELAERFRLTSSEVEGIRDWQKQLDGLVVGKVLTCVPHPNSDRLNLTTVDVGREILTIVCGAPNVATGLTVIVAKVGTTIHPTEGESITIIEREIRGIVSHGMLCGPDEVGLPVEPSQAHGLMLLPGSLKPGMPLAEAIGYDDQVLDVEITPNRPDLLSYVGLAREVAAFDKLRFTEPQIAILQDQQRGGGEVNLKVRIEDSRICQRYCAIVLEGDFNKPSPSWMQTRLVLSGQRPINLAVDVANYVMLELGQPQHTFDFDKLKSSEITVKSLAKSERLNLLDGTERLLEPGDIAIVDGNGTVHALAGIMGGSATTVGETTRRIVIESATFAGSQIRKTSRRLGLRSEASGRFEKGLDSELAMTALKRSVHLLQQEGATVISAVADEYPRTNQSRPRIHLAFARLQQISGVSIAPAECKGILQRLGFTVSSVTKSALEAVPPSWRADVTLPEDLIEELLRIWGFERIPTELPSGTIKAPERNERFDRTHQVRRVLAAGGFSETIHLPFASAATLEKTNLTAAAAIAVTDPFSEEYAFVSPTHLIPLLGSTSGRNRDRSQQSLFEIGQVYKKDGSHTLRLTLFLRGDESSLEERYRLAKGGILEVAKALGVTQLPSFETSDESLSYAAAGSRSLVLDHKEVLGNLAVIAPSVARAWKIRSGKSIVFAEIELDALLALPNAQPVYQAGSIFQSVERDMTLEVDENTQVGDMVAALASVACPVALRELSVTSIFRAKASAGRKSVTFHLTYQPLERTLTDADLKADEQALRAALT